MRASTLDFLAFLLALAVLITPWVCFTVIRFESRPEAQELARAPDAGLANSVVWDHRKPVVAHNRTPGAR